MSNLKKPISLLLALVMVFSLVFCFAGNTNAEGNEPTPASDADTLAATTKSVKVTYKTSTGMEHGSERVTVAKDAKVVPFESLTRIPEGYQVVGEITIRGSFATAIVEPKAVEPEDPTAMVTIKVVCGDTTLKTLNRMVVTTGNHTPADLGVAIPDGYSVVAGQSYNVTADTTEIIIKVAAEPAQPIEYTWSVKLRRNDRPYKTFMNAFTCVEGDDAALTAKVKALVPEGHELVEVTDINNATHFVTATVKKTAVAPTTKVINVKYETSTGIYKDQETVTVPKDATVVPVESLTKVPEGYQIVGEVKINGAYAKAIVDPIPTTKVINVKYETSTGIYKDQETVTVPKDATVVPVESLTKVPEGYQIVGEVEINGAYAKAIVDPIPTTKLITVKYQTSTGIYKGQENVKVDKNANVVPVESLTKIPEKWQVVGEVEIDGRFAIAIVEPVSDTKMINVKYETSTGIYKDQETVTVPKDATVVPVELLTKVPEGYQVVGKVEINGAYAKAIVDPIETEVPDDSNSRHIRVTFKMNGTGRTVDIKTFNVPDDQMSLTITAPEGYKLFDTNNVIALEKGQFEYVVLLTVEPTYRSVRIDYVLASGTCVGRERISVPYGYTAISMSMLNRVPEYCTIVNTNDRGITDETESIDILVERDEPIAPTKRSIRIDYVLASGTCIGRERIDVPYGYTAINMGMLERVPENCTIVNTNDRGITDETESVDILVERNEAPTHRSIRIDYVLASGTCVGRERIDVPYGYTAISMGMLNRVPEYCTIVNTNDRGITDETESIDILVERDEPIAPTKRSIRIDYVLASGTCIGRERIDVPFGYTAINMGMLKRVPENCTIVNTNDRGITDETESVDILVERNEAPVVPTKRSIRIDYVLASGTCIGRERIDVPYGCTAISMNMLNRVPENCTIVNTNDRGILDSTTSVDILVERNAKPETTPETKIIYVNYNTADGKNVLTTNMTVPYEAKSVSTSELKDVPYGYNLITKGEVVIDQYNAINVIVELKPIDANKDNVPKTGDNSNIVALSILAATSLAGAAALTMKKKSEEK